MTNAQYIRSMSDEELARFIENISYITIHGSFCNSIGKIGNESPGCWDSEVRKDCIACALDWLRQPKEDA